MSRSARSIALLLGFVVRPAGAQDVRDAETLPARTGAVILAPSLQFGTGHFDPSGTLGSIVDDYSGIRLAEALGGDAAEADFIELALDGSLGKTHFEASQTTVTINLTLAYGITDRWLVAAIVPYSHTTFDLVAWLDPGTERPSHFRVREAAAIQCPKGELELSDPTDLLTKVLEDGGADYQFNVGDLRKALTSPCLGYKDPIDEIYVDSGDRGLIKGKGTRTYSGFRDLVLATRYKFWHSPWLRASGTFYLLGPIGRPDDPDDLFDPTFGDEQWDAALLVGATTEYGRFKASLTTGYEIQFGDTVDRRLYGLSFSPELERRLANNDLSEADLYADHLDEASRSPLVTGYDRARIDRKLGDNFYVYAGASYGILEWLNLSVTADYRHHLRDAISDTGTRLADGARLPTSAQIRAAVEAEIAAGTLTADQREAALMERLPGSAERRAAAMGWHGLRNYLMVGFSVGVDFLKPFLRGDFPFPLIASVGANFPVAGSNNDVFEMLNFALAIPIAFGEVRDVSADDDAIEGHEMPWP